MKPLYKLKDCADEHIEGSFYEEEVQKVSQDYKRVYRIEEVLKKRLVKGKIIYFVKWIGDPEKFNSWVEEKDLLVI